MDTPYPSQVYHLAGSMYGTTDSTTTSTTMEDYGPSTELEEIEQNPTAAHLSPAYMYSQSMYASHPNVPYYAPGFVYLSENPTSGLQPVPASNQYYDHGSELGHMMSITGNAQFGLTQIPPAAPQSVRASCSRALCRWHDGSTSGICGATLHCKGVPDHFKDAHGIKGLNEFELVNCRWEGCSAKNRGRKNFVRHIREHHLKHSRIKGHSA